MILAKDSVAEALRVSHCSHPFPENHACIGSCKITPKGVILECTVCGDGQEMLTEEPGYHKLNRILGMVGISIEFLDPHVVRTMLAEMKGGYNAKKAQAADNDGS